MWQLQSPDETLDWHHDWSDWLEEGDAIATSEWEITPSGPLDTGAGTPTLADETIDAGTDVTTVWVSDLQPGQTYQLKNTVTTDDGRIGVREMTIRCAVQS